MNTPPPNANLPDHSSEKKVLRCTSTADFLAALPFLTGFTAQDSLFIVIFRGKRGTDAVRIDLPDERRAAETANFLSCLIDMLRDTGAGPASPALVITSSQRFNEAGEAPHGGLARRIIRRVRREGWSLRECAIVAADGWFPLLGGTPEGRRSLSEISASPIAAQTSALGLQSRPLESLWTLPAADPTRTAAVATRLQELQGRAHVAASSVLPGSSGSAARVSHMPGIARVAKACFDAGADEDPDLDARLLARLIDAAQTPQCWLVLALTALTRVELVEALIDGDEGEVLARIGVSGDGGEPHSATWSIAQLLNALAHDCPEPAKLRAAVAACAQAAAHASERMRPGLLSLMAWAWWMLGLQSASQQLVKQSLAIEPGHDLTRMVQCLAQTPPASRLEQLKNARAA